MTNQKILQIAMEQSALDNNCRACDFLSEENVIVESVIGLEARKYYKEPVACNLVSYGNNVVASVKNEYKNLVQEYISKFDCFYCFETPNMHWLNERMMKKGQKVCFMAEYFLPDVEKLQIVSELPSCDSCGLAGSWPFLQCKSNTCIVNIDLKILNHQDFFDLYLPQWSNALCKERKELDVLGVAPIIKEDWWGLQDVRRIAILCGRLEWMYCRNIEGKESLPVLPEYWQKRF